MNEYSKELAEKYTKGRDSFNDTDERLISCVKKVGIDMEAI